MHACTQKQQQQKSPPLEEAGWRCQADSNRCKRFCRPVPNHSDMAPWLCLRCKGTTNICNCKILQQDFTIPLHQQSFIYPDYRMGSQHRTPHTASCTYHFRGDSGLRQLRLYHCSRNHRQRLCHRSRVVLRNRRNSDARDGS